MTIDLRRGEVTVDHAHEQATYDLATDEAFQAVSRAWLRCGWDAQYVYSFTWMGRPIIQLPEDVVRLQELVMRVEPDVIVETGVAHGGSLVLYASLCKAAGRGRVIGVELELRPPNRRAIEEHVLAPLITLVDGSSTDPRVVEHVRTLLATGDRVLVVLDSAHTKEHVLAELEAYAPFVSEGSYIVAMDGIMEQLEGAPRSQPDWGWNNPRRAAEEFVARNPDFVVDEPEFLFNEGAVSRRVTYAPSGLLKRVRGEGEPG